MTIMGTQSPFWLDPRDRTYFPDVELAMVEPNGLLAVGGDLSPERLLSAYRHGIFPWYSEGQPILWWSPNPRAVLYLDQIRISQSLRKAIRRQNYVLRLDTSFAEVVAACATARGPDTGTWITEEMAFAYQQLYKLGYAHSIEVWRDNRLVGGLYGVALGRIFFGESMFSYERDASKIALVALVKHLAGYDFTFIDCQVASAHLSSLGATNVPRKQFAQDVAYYSAKEQDAAVWFNFITREKLMSML